MIRYNLQVKDFWSTDNIMSRRQARELSLQILYMQSFITNSYHLLKKNINYFAKFNNLKFRASYYFAQRLIKGTLKNKNVIDEIIREILKNWSIDRLSLVDLNILRLAIYEIKWCRDIPDKVAVNEANELAKKFSSKDSNKFVNGLLDGVIKKEGK